MSEQYLYGGECPVCGRDFVDGFKPLSEGEQYDAEICIVSKNEATGDGEMLIHLPGVLDDE